jgi:hypothetical protein
MKWGSGLILAQWEGSVTRCSGVMTSVGGEATPRSGKGGDVVNWVDVNVTGPKNEENQRGRFSQYK